MESHPAEMSRGENGSDEEALQRLTSIVQKIGEKSESLFSSAYIYRVPKYLRKHKESAYTPRLIAIGPLHREDEHLQTPFQHVKVSYMNNLLSRLTVGMEDLELAVKTKFTVIQECLAEMKTLIDDAKKCYAEKVTLNEEMMLVDGCFILEFFFGYRTLTVPETDPIFNAFAFDKVRNDLVLLENQIPFFVLEKLFSLTVGRISDRHDKNWSLTDYVRWCYGYLMWPVRNSNNNGSAKRSRVLGSTTAAAAEKEELYHIDDHRTAEYYHILHNLHDGYLPRYQRKKYIDFRKMPSASELVYAGVKFVPYAGNDPFKFSEPNGLFWWCRRARFEIPPLAIYNSTESYLRNLIALEQSCPGVSQYVSSYAWLMDILVNSDKDIQALEEAGILWNYLGGVPADAADLFNNLCKEVVAGEYFIDTYIKATTYRNRFWPKNMAHLRRTYFASPWTFIAFYVGFIVFIVTVLQFAHDFFKKSG